MEYDIRNDKIILHVHDRICETEGEILDSDLFVAVVTAAVKKLELRNSILLDVFGKRVVGREDINVLVEALKFLR